MTGAAPAVFSTVRENHFDPPAATRTAREHAPLTRVAFADGHLGWLVTADATARAVLSDPRFGTRGGPEHPAVPRATVLADPPAAPAGTPAPPGGPGHRRYRELLAGQFTDRRLRLLTEWTRKAAEERLDVMERAGSPADLFEHFALPVSSLVLCELLGVPHADRERFRHDAAVWSGHGASTEEVTAAFADLGAYLHGLVLRKRAVPGDDVLSGLVHGGDGLTDEELTSLALLLLLAGLETTAGQLALGVLALLRHPAQLAALRADPSLTEGAVEELLRYVSVVHHGPTRVALEDAGIDGVPVRKGEVVMVSLPAANRDPARYADPDALDVTRHAAGHLAFGHGVHRCLGRQLARVELRAGIDAVLRRFPGLRLAVPADAIPPRHDTQVYGVQRMPVAW
ncbi:cytochrome P450 Svu004 [Streptomyces albireticuli]|uniref:Cytochrome P450 Svu004 n=1 Tax=Streptomyces albireticuli TaxID=1940 RepID=A0A1Z2LB44_9ACTN|nr:cytochrome P450 [Streptomyces albireticuli]ARZ71438.1 cytochrome P450 Svu004 [Streptomyces albireticuli]